jgi:hypothetical protein
MPHLLSVKDMEKQQIKPIVRLVESAQRERERYTHTNRPLKFYEVTGVPTKLSFADITSEGSKILSWKAQMMFI